MGARLWGVLGLLCAANFMVILDSQIVLLALPSVERDLGFAGGGAQWVLSAYLLGFGGLLLLGGRTADLAGRRRTFLGGTALFLVASLLCGSAWTGGVLIGARVLQGISAALMAPSALSIVTATFAEGPERNRAIAVWGSVGGFGATAALLVGGPLTGVLGWRSIFFLNVPVAVLLLGLGPVLLAESRGGGRAYDPVGALTVTLAVSAAVYGVVRVPEVGWTSGWTAAAFAVAVVAGALFVRVEARSAAPLVPLRTFRSRRLVGGNTVTLVAAMAVFGTSFALSRFAQGVLAYSPLELGFATAVLPVMAVAGSYTAQAALRRVAVRQVAMAGLAVMAAGCLLLGRVTETSGYAAGLLPGLALLGFGLGACGVAGAVAALAGAAAGDAGLASGINTAAFQLGGAFGVAVSSTAVLSWPGPAAGFRAAFDASAGIALAGVLVVGVLLTAPVRRVSRPEKVRVR
ncbi:Predicted arabinose efflux permease, MFS family [Actinomadura madurae]|uniref:Predicted arabinose efflux permease, MFS family n=1 Tax=Actinomadura madurae TaxID=1993 RepID=A0A1I5LW35_9ACTN|nr:MFS transporter [Actinomadura madurae]SFP01578.1 Predicted arabinose efflux permease, MFS family [Actinomadura madurae]